MKISAVIHNPDVAKAKYIRRNRKRKNESIFKEIWEREAVVRHQPRQNHGDNQTKRQNARRNRKSTLDIPHKKILKKVLEQWVVAQNDLEKYAKNGDQNDKGDKDRPKFYFHYFQPATS